MITKSWRKADAVGEFGGSWHEHLTLLVVHDVVVVLKFACLIDLTCSRGMTLLAPTQLEPDQTCEHAVWSRAFNESDAGLLNIVMQGSGHSWCTIVRFPKQVTHLLCFGDARLWKLVIHVLSRNAILSQQWVPNSQKLDSRFLSLPE